MKKMQTSLIFMQDLSNPSEIRSSDDRQWNQARVEVADKKVIKPFFKEITTRGAVMDGIYAAYVEACIHTDGFIRLFFYCCPDKNLR